MARGQLSFLIMFEENLGPVKSFKRSFAMTKGHTVEMLGSLFASNYISGGTLLLPATSLAPYVGRYEDIKNLEKTGQQKPKTHWTNWLAIILPLLLFVGIGLFIVFGVISGTNGIKNQLQNYNSSTSSSSGNTTTLQSTQSNTSQTNATSASGSSQPTIVGALLSYLSTYKQQNGQYPANETTDMDKLVWSYSDDFMDGGGPDLKCPQDSKFLTYVSLANQISHQQDTFTLYYCSGSTMSNVTQANVL
jgi:hypothetical protein